MINESKCHKLKLNICFQQRPISQPSITKLLLTCLNKFNNLKISHCNSKLKCYMSKHSIYIPLLLLMFSINFNNSCKSIKIHSIIIIFTVQNKSNLLLKNIFLLKTLNLLLAKFFMTKKMSSCKSTRNMKTFLPSCKECLFISYLKDGLINGNNLFLLSQKLLGKILDQSQTLRSLTIFIKDTLIKENTNFTQIIIFSNHASID